MILLKRYVPIKTKLFFILFFLLCVPFVVFMFIWYNSSSRVIEKNTFDFTRPLIKQTSDYLDSYIKGLEKVTLPLTLSPLINKFLDIEKSDYYNQLMVSTDIKNEIYPKLIDGRNDIYMLSIISGKGIHYTNGDDVDVNIMKTAYRDSVRWNGDKSFGIQGVVYLSKFTPTITVYRELSTSFAGNSKGSAIINLNLRQIQAFSDIKLGNTGFIWIIDWDGKYLYHPDKDKLGKKVDDAIINKIGTNRTEYFIEEILGQKKLFVYNSNSTSACTVICEVPVEELTRNLVGMRNFSIWLTFLAIIFILVVLGGYSYYLTNSITRLKKLMNRVECGELDVKAPVYRNDEFGQLNSSFNAMVSEIRRLIEVVHTAQLNEKEAQLQHREATLHALQSQINPHFLYNVLETINSYAIIKGVMPISNMVTCLSDMFRYCVNNTRHIVRLDDEIEHVKTYLAIQVERTSVLNVDCVFDEPGVLNSVKCARLSLQPIAENAFIHGYEKHELSPEYIGIFGWKKDMYYELAIIDKGKGMNAETLEYYNDRFSDNLDSGTGENEERKTCISIGMWNVHMRIRLIFGEQYGLFIERSDEQGTDIRIRLPYA